MKTKSTEKSPISGFLHAVNCASHAGAISERFDLDCEISPDVDWRLVRYDMAMIDKEKDVVVQIAFTASSGPEEIFDISVPEEFSWTTDKERVKVAKALLRYHQTKKKRDDSLADYRLREAKAKNRAKMASVYN
ncbi:hypothetical protein [Burkholderia pseudomallei]|uniref:hypothetical protein n=1 Tax=Burkholderia pseudomallei TaxID=28450 RepID=UPI0024E01C98|nr:hypothetical protein [Burkholderia pseudomallei]